MARIYGRSYRGRKYYFQVVGIEGNVVYLQNIETFSESKVNSQFVKCKDDKILINDIIERQYHREGLGIYDRGGGEFSEGSTVWVNTTSEDRYNNEHVVTTFIVKYIGIIISFLLVVGFFVPPLGILCIYAIGFLYPVYLVVKMIEWIFK